MSTTTAQGSGSTNNNTGVVSIPPGRFDPGFVGSKVLASSGDDYTVGVQKAVTAGTLAYFADRNFLIRKASVSIGGIPNLSLQGGSEFGQVRRVKGNTKQTDKNVVGAIQAGYWNIFTGTWSTPPSAINTFHRSTTNNGVEAVDEEASVSRASQGNFTYKGTAPVPVNASYDAKTG